MGFVQANVIYKGEEFVGCTKQTLINSALVENDPKQAWVYPNKYGYYLLTFADPNQPGALTGVWVAEKGSDQGVLLDGTLAAVQAGLSACCSSTPVVIAGVYNGVFPPIVDRSLAVYTITRTDDGTISDLQDFMLAYLDWAQPVPPLQRPTYSSGTSTYVFSAYTDPRIQGNDVLVSESARLFLSNVPAALVSGNKYSLVGYINGDPVGTAVSGTTNGALSTLVTALTADANYGPLGTWSVVSGAIQLSSTTVDSVSLSVTQAV